MYYITMIWWRCPAEFYKKNLLQFDPRTVQIKAFVDRINETTFLAIGAILFDSMCTQGSQQLKNEKCNLWNPGCNLVSNLSVEIDKLKNVMKKGGKRPWECCLAVHPRHINYLIPQCYAKEKRN